MKKEIIKAVTQQVINMLYNDIIEDNGTESFECWCVGGEVFVDNDPELDEDDVLRATRLMQNIAPFVDELTTAIDKNMDGWKEPIPNYFLDYTEKNDDTGRKVSKLTEYSDYATAKTDFNRIKKRKYVVHAVIKDTITGKVVCEYPTPLVLNNNK